MTTRYLVVKITSDEDRDVSRAGETIRRVVHAVGNDPRIAVADAVFMNNRRDYVLKNTVHFAALDDFFTSYMDKIKAVAANYDRTRNGRP